MKQYFKIGPMAVSQAAALSGGLLMGMPALYAYTGWLKKLSLVLSRALHVGVSPIAISPVFHTFSLHRGHAKFVRYRPGQISDVAARGPNHPTVDEQRSSFEITLLVALHCEDTEIDTSTISKSLRGMKLAGGGISSASVSEIDIRVSKLTHDNLYKGLPFNAVALADASYVLDDASKAGVNRFEAMLQALAAPSAFGDVKEGSFQRPMWMLGDDKVGRFLPVCIGAIALESLKTPSERSGIRQADTATEESPTTHAFAESAFTLVRAQTIASVRANAKIKSDNGQSYEPPIFWQEKSPLIGEPPFYGVRSIQGNAI